MGRDTMVSTATRFAPAQRATMESVQSHASLLRKTDLLKQLYDAVNEIILILSQQRQIVFYNGLFAKMQRASFTSQGFQLFSPQDVAGLMQEAGFGEIHIDHNNRNKLADRVIVLGKALAVPGETQGERPSGFDNIPH